MKKTGSYKVEMVYKGRVEKTFYLYAHSTNHARNKAKMFARKLFWANVLTNSKFKVTTIK